MEDPAPIVIKDWWTAFETSESHRNRNLSWWAAPVGCSSRKYFRLMKRGKDGIHAFGIFSALCQLMASQKRHVRILGAFLDPETTKPLTLDYLADLLFIDEAELTTAVQLLESEEIGWISRNLPEPPGDCRNFPEFPKLPGAWRSLLQLAGASRLTCTSTSTNKSSSYRTTFGTGTSSDRVNSSPNGDHDDFSNDPLIFDDDDALPRGSELDESALISALVNRGVNRARAKKFVHNPTIPNDFIARQIAAFDTRKANGKGNGANPGAYLASLIQSSAPKPGRRCSVIADTSAKPAPKPKPTKDDTDTDHIEQQIDQHLATLTNEEIATLQAQALAQSPLWSQSEDRAGDKHNGRKTAILRAHIAQQLQTPAPNA